jgi:hypothetical protein
MTGRITVYTSMALLLAGFGGWALTQEAPDSQLNPVTGSIETVFTVPEGEQLDVHHATDRGTGAPSVTIPLSAHPADDLDPRLTVDDGGGAWVVWWREGGVAEVLLRQRRNARGAFSETLPLSEPHEHSVRPEILHDGEKTWVVYEIEEPGGTGIAVLGGGTSVPWPTRTIVALVDGSESVDARIHADSGHLWVTWIEGFATVGWSEYDYEADVWGVPAFEEDGGADTAAARQRIRELVVD